LSAEAKVDVTKRKTASFEAIETAILLDPIGPGINVRAPRTLVDTPSSKQNALILKYLRRSYPCTESQRYQDG
jgi:hypothetical protein